MNIDMNMLQLVMDKLASKPDFVNDFYGMLNEYKALAIKHGVPDEDLPKTAQFLTDWFELMCLVEGKENV